MWVRAIRATDVEVVAAVTGRPTVLDDLKAKRICDAVAAGNTRRCAAATAGIAYATMKLWVQRGKKGEQPYLAFLARLEKADAEAEEAAVKEILVAARDGSWQAAAWWLERRRRQTWRRPDQPREREEDLSAVDDEKLWEAVEALRKEKTG